MISHEEIGDSCESCGNSHFMCDCQKCNECREYYAPEDINYGMCADCFDDFEKLDLEDRMEKLL